MAAAGSRERRMVLDFDIFDIVERLANECQNRNKSELTDDLLFFSRAFNGGFKYAQVTEEEAEAFRCQGKNSYGRKRGWENA